MGADSSNLAMRRAALRIVLASCVVAATVMLAGNGGEGGSQLAAAAASIDTTNHMDVVGSLDMIAAASGAVEIVGWALTADDPHTEALIEITAGGEVLAQIQPGADRFDVEAAYGAAGRSAGYDALVPVPAGVPTVCVDVRRSGSNTPVRLGCGAADAEAAAQQRAALTGLVAGLGAELEAELPELEVAIAVIPFDTGELSNWRGHRLFISASAAKSWWTAAALAAGQADEARAFAAPLFEDSSDVAAGSMIDLAGGIDAVNEFTLNAGMRDTAAIKWTKAGIVRRSDQFPGPLNGSNHVDASDAAYFFYRLGTNQLLSPDLTTLLAEWMRSSPRDSSEDSPEASTIPDSLPPDVKALVEQKSGWLRPDEFRVAPHLLNVGIVHPTNGGPSHAIALMGAGGGHSTYARLIEFFQSASCQIYVHVAADADWPCPDW